MRIALWAEIIGASGQPSGIEATTASTSPGVKNAAFAGTLEKENTKRSAAKSSAPIVLFLILFRFKLYSRQDVMCITLIKRAQASP